jgi:hypothetical protein
MAQHYFAFLRNSNQPFTSRTDQKLDAIWALALKSLAFRAGRALSQPSRPAAEPARS